MSRADDRRPIYVGSAARWRQLHPESGEELLLEHAVKDAYDNAMENSDGSERQGPTEGCGSGTRVRRS